MQSISQLYQSALWLLSDSTFITRPIPQLTPLESRLRKLENERKKLQKLVWKEKINSLKLSMTRAILKPLQALEQRLQKNKETLMNAGNNKYEREISPQKASLPVAQ